MFEVYYRAPADQARESRIAEAIRPFGGAISSREVPVAGDVSQAVVLTCEFGDYASAEGAANSLRASGEHVEAISEY